VQEPKPALTKPSFHCLVTFMYSPFFINNHFSHDRDLLDWRQRMKLHRLTFGRLDFVWTENEIAPFVWQKDQNEIAQFSNALLLLSRALQ